MMPLTALQEGSGDCVGRQGKVTLYDWGPSELSGNWF